MKRYDSIEARGGTVMKLRIHHDNSLKNTIESQQTDGQLPTVGSETSLKVLGSGVSSAARYQQLRLKYLPSKYRGGVAPDTKSTSIPSQYSKHGSIRQDPI